MGLNGLNKFGPKSAQIWLKKTFLSILEHLKDIVQNFIGGYFVFH